MLYYELFCKNYVSIKAIICLYFCMKPITIKKILLFTLSVFFLFTVSAKEEPGIGIGADIAYPYIEAVLKTMTFPKNTVYTLTDSEVKKLIDKSASIHINMFELVDCLYRYLKKNNYRIKIRGNSLRVLNTEYSLVRYVSAKLLPIDNIDYIETGIIIKSTDNALDVFLLNVYSTDLDFGIGYGVGYYETHFGFKKVEPLLFSDCFGLTVQIWGVKHAVSKLHLYDRGKGSFFIKNFFKGKHWYLDLIEKK